MSEGIKEIGDKLDNHFEKLNEKYDRHEKKEWHLLDQIVSRLDKTDDNLFKLEKDVASHTGILIAIGITLVVFAVKVFIY